MNIPDKIYNVSQTQFSVARYSMGCNINGAFYLYNPVDDTLTKEQPKVRKKRKPSKSTVQEGN